MSFLFVNHDVLNCNFIEVKDIPSISSISAVDLSILGNTLMSKVFFEDNIFPQNGKIIIKQTTRCSTWLRINQVNINSKS